MGSKVGWKTQMMEVVNEEREDIEIGGFASRGAAHPNFNRLQMKDGVSTAVSIQLASTLS